MKSLRRWLKRAAVARRRRFLQQAHYAALAACNRKLLTCVPHHSARRNTVQAVPQ
jgi:hypothetical protein